MSIELAGALDRTLLLMRDNLSARASSVQLLDALTSTKVVLVADVRNLSSHAAQSAYVSAALLMARSGHRVYLAAPDVPLIGAQPPLVGTHIVSALLDTGRNLLPGIEFVEGVPDSLVDLSVSFGDSGPSVCASRAFCVNATAWSGIMGSPSTAKLWLEQDWPCGAMAVGALVASEAFKASMRKLRCLGTDDLLFDQLFAHCEDLTFNLAPSSAPRGAYLGKVDFVSGGAITNAALFALARLPGVRGGGQIIEPEVADASNLNRYAMLLRSDIGKQKAQILQKIAAPHLDLQAVVGRYEGGRMLGVNAFSPSVLVGVDDISARWKVQEADPHWLGIGATTHWSAMASFHNSGVACAQCLHPRDDLAIDRIPTVAFVSFSAGLLLACYFMRAMAGEATSVSEQYSYMSPLRPERVWRSPVSVRSDCPICERRGKRAA